MTVQARLSNLIEEVRVSHLPYVFPIRSAHTFVVIGLAPFFCNRSMTLQTAFSFNRRMGGRRNGLQGLSPENLQGKKATADQQKSRKKQQNVADDLKQPSHRWHFHF